MQHSWEKLFAAQRAYGEAVRPLLKTKRPPFEQPPKNYIGKRAEQILEQFKQGIPVQQISRDLGVHPMTVCRHVDRAGLRDGS
ncbi:helix-turn-helix domain-containing protein [Planctomycetes bacterium CA13]|uniref:helix-turn-helix domain-containing protein n=1 Tax=Novipirellula herctigrandis TaxID=2527986 RepID=UPI0011B73B4E